MHEIMSGDVSEDVTFHIFFYFFKINIKIGKQFDACTDEIGTMSKLYY